MKACFANQRVILGALEMYNMDNEAMLTFMSDDVIKRLSGQNSMKGGISLPDPQCAYTSIGDLTTTGSITCKFHGSVR